MDYIMRDCDFVQRSRIMRVDYYVDVWPHAHADDELQIKVTLSDTNYM